MGFAGCGSGFIVWPVGQANQPIPLFFLLSDAWYRASTTHSKVTGFAWRKVLLMAVGLMASAVVISVLLGSTGVEKSTKWPTIALWDLDAVSLAENRVLIPGAELNYKDEAESQTPGPYTGLDKWGQSELTQWKTKR